MPLSLRWLEPADLDAYRALRLAGLRESPSAFGSSAEEEEALSMSAFVERLAPAADRAVFGAFDGAHLVALAGLQRETKAKRAHKANVFGVYVAPGSRGRGIGRELLRFAIAQARAWPGLRRLLLCVNADNAAAIALYASLGFTTYGREPEAVCLDGRCHDELLMALRLDPPGDRT